MEGGPAAMDLFDPKPKLRELAGQPYQIHSVRLSLRWVNTMLHCLRTYESGNNMERQELGFLTGLRILLPVSMISQ